VRKNVRNLTDYEFHDLLQAFDKFKKDLSSDGYMVQNRVLQFSDKTTTGTEAF